MKVFDKNIGMNYGLNQHGIGFKSDFMPQIPQMSQTVDAVQPDVELPDMYYIPENYKKEKTLAQKVKKTDVLGLIHPWFEHPLLMIATCTGLSLGVDAFDKSCNKSYENSIVGKAANFGDKIEQSSLVQNNTSKGILRKIKKGWSKVKTLAMKNKVINAMVTTPSEPEWAIPKDELKHTNYRIVTKFRELASDFGMVPDGLIKEGKKKKDIKIKNLALDKTEIENLKKLYNVERLSQIPENEVVTRVMLQRLGKNESEIASVVHSSNPSEIITGELLKKSGLTAAELEAIFKDETGETFDLVKKASGNLKGTRLAHGKIVIPGPTQPFANVEGFEGIYNRAHSITEGAATKTGRFMSKLVQKIYRGFTFGNQKQAVLIWVTPFLVGSILNTIKADRDEKVGTAVSGIINAFSWVFTFPIALMGIHAFGGIQYAGMGKEKVDEYKKLVNEFNEKVKSNGFKDISEYRTAKKALKQQLRNLRKVPNQNLLTIGLRGISKFSKADLLKLESYKNGSKPQDFIRRLPNLIKDYVIYAPGRMIVFMFVGLALADKIIDKTLSLLFGKPYDGMKDDELKDAQFKQEEYSINDLRTRLLAIQKEKLYPSNNEASAENVSKLSELQGIITEAMRKEMSEIPTDSGEATDVTDTHKTDNPEGTTAAEPEVVTGTDKQGESKNEISMDKDSQPNEQVIADKLIDDNRLAQDGIALAAEDFKYKESDLDAINQPAEEFVKGDRLSEKEQSSDATDTKPSGKIFGEPTNSQDGKSVSQDSLMHKRDNYTYIPSQDSVLNQSNPTQPVYKYIPSQVGININKVFDNSALEAALRRANRAEQKALDVLAGNFGNL